MLSALGETQRVQVCMQDRGKFRLRQSVYRRACKTGVSSDWDAAIVSLYLIMCATVAKLKCRLPVARALCNSNASSSPSLSASILWNHCDGKRGHYEM